MGYKVKRFSILREKEIAFSDRSRDLEWLNQNRTICYEIIKCIESYDTPDVRNFHHWMSKAIKGLIPPTNDNRYSSSLPLARTVKSLWLLSSEEDIKLEVSKLYGTKFIADIRKDIDKDYPLLRNHVYDDEFYVSFFSMLANILEDPDLLETIDTGTLFNINNIRIKVSTSRRKINDPFLMKDIVVDYIYKVKGYNYGKLFDYRNRVRPIPEI